MYVFYILDIIPDISNVVSTSKLQSSVNGNYAKFNIVYLGRCLISCSVTTFRFISYYNRTKARLPRRIVHLWKNVTVNWRKSTPPRIRPQICWAEQSSEWIQNTRPLSLVFLYGPILKKYLWRFFYSCMLPPPPPNTKIWTNVRQVNFKR